MKIKNVKSGFFKSAGDHRLHFGATLELSRYTLLHCNLQVFRCWHFQKKLEVSYTIRNAYVSAEGSPGKVRLVIGKPGSFDWNWKLNDCLIHQKLLDCNFADMEKHDIFIGWKPYFLKAGFFHGKPFSPFCQAVFLTPQ